MTQNDPVEIQTIAILGGTGKEGRGLAYRWAKAGYSVLIGSRSTEKAQNTVCELVTRLGSSAKVEGATYQDAVRRSDAVVLTIPYQVHHETLISLIPIIQDRILIDVTVPLVPPKVTQVHIPPEGSIGLTDLKILGSGVRIATAFQNVSYEHLLLDDPIDCDVLVSGIDKPTRQQVIRLVEAAGLRGWDAGPLSNSIIAEGLTSILIHINKTYGSSHAGIKITGVVK